MATINDVAKRAGVSRSTVSLVLNKSPLVKEEVEEKMQEFKKAFIEAMNNPEAK